MSLYNMVMGMNTDLVMAVSALLGMNIREDFPRFRNVFTNDDGCPMAKDDYDFIIYTRMGGGNRECWEGIDAVACDCAACVSNRLEAMGWVVARYDDNFDSTYTNNPQSNKTQSQRHGSQKT